MNKLFLLQVNPPIEKGTNILFQYGVLGVFAVLMIAVLYYMETLRRKREEEIKGERKEYADRLAKLEQRFQDYQDEDRKEMEKMLAEVKDVMESNVELMKEMKQLIIIHNRN
jgi:hypothetical protein